MKAITITIPEQLDKRAAAEARRQGISKSELIRRGLAAVLPEDHTADEDNPWITLAGFGSADVTFEPGEIDAIAYDQ